MRTLSQRERKRTGAARSSRGTDASARSSSSRPSSPSRGRSWSPRRSMVARSVADPRRTEPLGDVGQRRRPVRAEVAEDRRLVRGVQVDLRAALADPGRGGDVARLAVLSPEARSAGRGRVRRPCWRPGTPRGRRRSVRRWPARCRARSCRGAPPSRRRSAARGSRPSARRGARAGRRPPCARSPPTSPCAARRSIVS